MQPLINLRQFIAMLLLLVIPVALLVAYFRKFDPQAGGHQHSEATEHIHGATEKKADNENVPKGNVSEVEALREQFEASRIQFEASRMQLDASRTALEVMTSDGRMEKKPDTAPHPEHIVPMQQKPSSSNGHVHKHGEH